MRPTKGEDDENFDDENQIGGFACDMPNGYPGFGTGAAAADLLGGGRKPYGADGEHLLVDDLRDYAGERDLQRGRVADHGYLFRDGHFRGFARRNQLDSRGGDSCR